MRQLCCFLDFFPTKSFCSPALNINTLPIWVAFNNMQRSFPVLLSLGVPRNLGNPNELWLSPVKTCVVLPHSRLCPRGCLWIIDLIKWVLSLSPSLPPFPVTLQFPEAFVWDLPCSSVEEKRGLTGNPPCAGCKSDQGGRGDLWWPHFCCSPLTHFNSYFCCTPTPPTLAETHTNTHISIN